jgi:hypothetical protein
MIAESKKQTALRKAEDQFTRAANRDAAFRAERDKIASVEAAKTARLRALRLAKEEADREAAANAPVAETPAASKRRVRKINVAS